MRAAHARGARMTGHLEIESSFAVLDLDSVLATLLPWGWTVDIDGANHGVEIRRISGTLHLYSQRTAGAERERLKLGLDGTRLRLVHEHKRLVNDDKLEQLIACHREASAVLAAVNEYGGLAACFAKRRLTLSLRRPGRPALKVAVDRVVAFDPESPDRVGPLHTHLEIEAREREAIRAVLDSRWFASGIAPHVRPLIASDTKWMVAAPLCAPGARVSFSSFPELHDYVVRVLLAAFPPTNRLEPC